jgi:RNA polymerase sigma-70 factor (ECF subfamily)
MSDDADRDPSAEVLHETISLAPYDALQKLPAAESGTLVLRNVVGMKFADITETVGRTPTACQELASSAPHGLASARSASESGVQATLRGRQDES